MPNNLFENLLLRGAIFRTRVKVPSGKRKLNLERLNIPPTFENSDLVTSGQLVLIPSEEMKVFNQLRGKATGVIEKYGVPVGSIGLLVPNEKINRVNEELASLRNDFNGELHSLQDKFPEIKQALLSQWNQEIISLAARHSTDESYIFEVMRKIEGEFHDWDHYEGKFGFSWNEYHDINEMAQAFIEDATRDILERMRDFAENLRKRLQDEKISERNLKPIRSWIESVGQAIRSFENQRLNRMLEDLESWTEVGVDAEVSQFSDSANNMKDVLDDMITTCTEHVDEIAAESIEALTTQRRVVQRRVS